ncbi:hypothetical protein ABIB45_004097 [Arthrobacter sp. UYCo732]
MGYSDLADNKEARIHVPSRCWLEIPQKANAWSRPPPAERVWERRGMPLVSSSTVPCTVKFLNVRVPLSTLEPPSVKRQPNGMLMSARVP